MHPCTSSLTTKLTDRDASLYKFANYTAHWQRCICLHSALTNLNGAVPSSVLRTAGTWTIHTCPIVLANDISTHFKSCKTSKIQIYAHTHPPTHHTVLRQQLEQLHPQRMYLAHTTHWCHRCSQCTHCHMHNRHSILQTHMCPHSGKENHLGKQGHMCTVCIVTSTHMHTAVVDGRAQLTVPVLAVIPSVGVHTFTTSSSAAPTIEAVLVATWFTKSWGGERGRGRGRGGEEGGVQDVHTVQEYHRRDA